MCRHLKDYLNTKENNYIFYCENCDSILSEDDLEDNNCCCPCCNAEFYDEEDDYVKAIKEEEAPEFFKDMADNCKERASFYYRVLYELAKYVEYLPEDKKQECKEKCKKVATHYLRRNYIHNSNLETSINSFYKK